MARVLPLLSLLLIFATLEDSKASLILATDFNGRTVAGNTASNIPWTLGAVTDPGNLTVQGPPALAGLFNTPNAQNYFAPNLNTDNEGAWFVDIPLAFAPNTAALQIEDITMEFRNFNNSGNFQPNNLVRPTPWRVDVVGSSSGIVDTDTATSNSFDAGTTLNLAFPGAPLLDKTENWSLRLTVGLGSGAGNNTGLNSVAINGVVFVPEPSSALGILGLVSAVFVRRRRRRVES